MKSKFSSSQITLHWLVFILVAIAYATIELRGYAGHSLRPWVIGTHFSCGAAVLVLMLSRVFLRVKHPHPPITPAPPRLQQYLAHLTHF